MELVSLSVPASCDKVGSRCPATAPCLQLKRLPQKTRTEPKRVLPKPVWILRNPAGRGSSAQVAGRKLPKALSQPRTKRQRVEAWMEACWPRAEGGLFLRNEVPSESGPVPGDPVPGERGHRSCARRTRQFVIGPPHELSDPVFGKTCNLQVIFGDDFNEGLSTLRRDYLSCLLGPV